jgi:hypothetical protein
MPDSYKSIMYAASPGKDLPKQTLFEKSQNLLDPRAGGNSDLYDITGFPPGRGCYGEKAVTVVKGLLDLFANVKSRKY